MFSRFLLLSGFFCGLGSLSAQLVVYKLEFEKVGDTVNFRAFNTGFYVAPAAGGKGTLLLGVMTGATKGQVSKDSAGDLTATTSNDSANISMLLLGEPKATLTSTTVATTTTSSVTTRGRVPEFMSGTMLVSDTAADTGAVTDVNATAGTAKVKARIDMDLSKSLSKNNSTLAAAVTALQTRLTNQGYTAADTGTGGTTTGTTTTGTTTGTTTSATTSATTTTGTATAAGN